MLGSDISESIAPAELKKIATSVGHLFDVDIMEVYSPERVAKLFWKHGPTLGCSLDQTNGYDFDKAEDRERAWEIIRRDKPTHSHWLPTLHLCLNVARVERVCIQRRSGTKSRARDTFYMSIRGWQEVGAWIVLPILRRCLELNECALICASTA